MLILFTRSARASFTTPDLSITPYEVDVILQLVSRSRFNGKLIIFKEGGFSGNIFFIQELPEPVGKTVDKPVSTKILSSCRHNMQSLNYLLNKFFLFIGTSLIKYAIDSLIKQPDNPFNRTIEKRIFTFTIII